MSTPTHTSDEPLVYRPISALALVGFVLACLFAGLVVLSALVALTRGEPLFLWGWLLGLAAIALLLSLLGMWQIRNSEGTRAGMGLARWGVWLSGFLGLTYFAYAYVTGLAITTQANDFLLVAADEDSGFFPRLFKAQNDRSELYHAFLLTLPAAERGGAKPTQAERFLKQHNQPTAEGGPGRVQNFRRHNLILALTQPGEEPKIEALGVLGWSYKENSYEVVRNYRITTAERTWEVPFTLKSTEAFEAGEARRWTVQLPYSQTPPQQVTALGQGLAVLRISAKQRLEQQLWQALQGKGGVKAYKEDDTDWHKLPLTEAQRQHVRDQVNTLFSTGAKDAVQFSIDWEMGAITPWSREKDERVRLGMPAKIHLPPSGKFAPFTIDAELLVETAAPADPLNLTSQPQDWVIRRVTITYAAAIGPAKTKKF